jgi:methylenetetrahydrofolate--tRNA-(uracil-5-)-methyltransferase
MAWPNWSAPTPSVPTMRSKQCGRPAACRDAAGELADHALRRRNQVPAGGALAVDRDGFSQAVTKALEDHPLITIDRAEDRRLPPAEWDSVIVATGPLTSPARGGHPRPDRRGFAGLLRRHRADRLFRLDRHGRRLVPVALRQGRPRRHGADYINCPMDEAQYNAFIDALMAGDTTDFKEWEGTRPISTAACRSR